MYIFVFEMCISYILDRLVPLNSSLVTILIKGKFA